MDPKDAISTLVRVAEDRGGPLVGNPAPLCDMLQRAIVGDCIPGVVLEMPLGTGGTDAFAVYRYQRPYPDRPVWFEDAFKWFSTTSGDSALYLALDVDTDTAGAYLEFVTESYNVAPFADSIGLDPAWVADVIDTIPERWPVHYIGHFPSRQGQPLRLGGYLPAEGIGELGPRDLSGFAPTKGAAEMGLRVAGLAAEFGCTADWQLDVLSDGSVGDRFSMGIGVVNLPDDDLREVIERLGVGYGYARSLIGMRHTAVSEGCTVTLTPSIVKASHDGTSVSVKAYVGATVTPR